MIKLTAKGKFTFYWKHDPPQWLMREDAGGQPAVTVRPTPFVIGRSSDCSLVLPESSELAKTTSRWHCNIQEKDGGCLITDGSLKPIPQTGRSKPSVSGTFLNGVKLSVPAALKSGDSISIGPWQLEVSEAMSEVVSIDRLFAQITSEKPRELSFTDNRAQKAYGTLPGLFDKLAESTDSEECLQVILTYALEHISAAQVAAVVVADASGEPVVRMAWQRDQGRLLDLRISQGLMKGLSPGRAFLLQSEMLDPTKSQLENKISSGLIIPLRSHKSRLGLLYMDNRNHGVSFSEADLYLGHALSSVATLHLILERQALLQRTEQNMRKYFGPDVVGLILEESRKGHNVSLGVKEYEATVLFVDMVNFSGSCRGRTPQEIAELINPYYQLISECIQRHGGHVDKFIGDAVLGVFGAHPVVSSTSAPVNHAAAAVRAAREMITTWGWSAPSGWGAHVPVRIGINSGKVVAGNIGFAGRMEYSVLGDNVNLAAHLQKYAAPDTIILTESTRRILGDEGSCSEGAETEVKGFGKIKTFRAA